MRSEADYTGVTVGEVVVRKDQKFIIAEPPVIQGRLHRRVIGTAQDDARGEQRLDGKPLLYSDTYLTSQKTYTYARHRATPKEFFSGLDSLTSEYSELRQGHFPSYITVDKEVFRISLQYPLMELLRNDGGESIRFFKITFPFGEMSIQFGEVHVTKDNQRVSCQQEHILTKAVESPILGYQSTEDRPLFLPLFMRLHWASDHIPVDILEYLINEITSVGVSTK
jgi:hypothetical protein